VVISVEAAGVANAILVEYLASEVALEEPEIGCTGQDIPRDKDCTDDELHFGIPGGSGDYEDANDERAVHEAIPTANGRRRPTTELGRFDLRTTDVDGYVGEVGDDVYVDEEEEASQADEGSTQNLED